MEIAKVIAELVLHSTTSCPPGQEQLWTRSKLPQYFMHPETWHPVGAGNEVAVWGSPVLVAEAVLAADAVLVAAAADEAAAAELELEAAEAVLEAGIPEAVAVTPPIEATGGPA